MTLAHNPRERSWNDIVSRHRGACFVVTGSGPSLGDCDLGMFSSMITIGSNAIGYKTWPLYYSIFDPVSYENFNEIFYCSPSIRILPPWIDGPCDIRIGYDVADEVGFSVDRLFHGRSSGFANVGLAARMGAREIHVIGIDGYDSAPNPYFFSAPDSYVRRSLGKWTDDRKSLTIRAYTAAAVALHELGISFVNHSPISFLTDIPHVDQAW